MFITYHLVEGDEERRDIFSRLSPGEIWEGGDIEAMGIAQADELPLAYAITTSLGPYTSKLIHSCFPSPEGDGRLPLHLLDYLGWELKETGKRFLFIEKIATISSLARGLGLRGIHPDSPILVKLDDDGFLDLLAASA